MTHGNYLTKLTPTSSFSLFLFFLSSFLFYLLKMFNLTPQLYDKIKYFARFPQTGVSLRQMVLFGQKPSQGTLFKASQFLHEELPIRLAHCVKELDELPQNLVKCLPL
ncbi:unnamed protein product [Mucor hiemalis]